MAKRKKTVRKQINKLCICRSDKEGMYSVWTPGVGKCWEDNLTWDEAVAFCKNTTDFVSMPISENSKEYLKKYINVSEKDLFRIGKHILRYQLFDDNRQPYEICAYYKDWKDFCSNWCDHKGFTKTEARKLLHLRNGEFMELSIGIIRFAM